MDHDGKIRFFWLTIETPINEINGRFENTENH